MLPRPLRVQHLPFDLPAPAPSAHGSEEPSAGRDLPSLQCDLEEGDSREAGHLSRRADPPRVMRGGCMKITFVKPNIGRMEHSLYVDEGRMEPLQIGVVAALTPPDVECVLYDDRMEEIPYDEPTDLAAITVEIYTARRAYEIAAEFRRRGVPVIMGGFQPTLAPEECLEHADSIYIGDAEFLWHEVVADARERRLRRVYKARAGIPQPGGTQPRRDLFKKKGYLPVTLMQFSRGCRFACDFCAISVYFDRTQFVRLTREVLAEIENQDRKFIFFVDDNFLSNHQAAKLFLRELIPLRIRWVSQGSIDMTNDPELMDLLEASGCVGNVIRFEP